MYRCIFLKVFSNTCMYMYVPLATFVSQKSCVTFFHASPPTFELYMYMYMFLFLIFGDIFSNVLYIYMNNHVHSALQSIGKEIAEQRKKHKSSSHTCIQQLQQFRKIDPGAAWLRKIFITCMQVCLVRQPLQYAV